MAQPQSEFLYGDDGRCGERRLAGSPRELRNRRGGGSRVDAEGDATNGHEKQRGEGGNEAAGDTIVLR